MNADWPGTPEIRLASAVANRFARAAAALRIVDRDDMRQEAISGMWKYLAAHPEPASTTILHRVAVCSCVAAIRRARGRGRGLRPVAPPPENIRDHAAGKPDPDPGDRLDVREAIDSLSPAPRATIIDAMGGFTGPEIARKDGVAIKSVESRLRRGRAALRVLLAAYRPETQSAAADSSAE